MGNFNRDRGNKPDGGRGFERRGFNDRSSRGPVEMHQAVCSKCGKDCELPFKPTSDRPVFCSSCFENNRPTDSRNEGRNFDRPTNFEDREMFTATCADCGNSCQVPFRPTNGKPVFCSNCFGDKKEGRGNRREQSNPQPQNRNEFVELNAKLDKILVILTPNIVAKVVAEPARRNALARNASHTDAGGSQSDAGGEIIEIKELLIEEQPVETEKKTKVIKKKSSKKI